MEYPVLLEGEQVGTAAVVEEGERLAVSLDCREDNRGLFRGYLICPEGRSHWECWSRGGGGCGYSGGFCGRRYGPWGGLRVSDCG